MKMRPIISLFIALIALTLPAIGANASAAFEASSFDEHVGSPRKSNETISIEVQRAYDHEKPDICKPSKHSIKLFKSLGSDCLLEIYSFLDFKIDLTKNIRLVNKDFNIAYYKYFKSNKYPKVIDTSIKIVTNEKTCKIGKPNEDCLAMCCCKLYDPKKIVDYSTDRNKWISEKEKLSTKLKDVIDLVERTNREYDNINCTIRINIDNCIENVPFEDLKQKGTKLVSSIRKKKRERCCHFFLQNCYSLTICAPCIIPTFLCYYGLLPITCYEECPERCCIKEADICGGIDAEVAFKCAKITCLPIKLFEYFPLFASFSQYDFQISFFTSKENWLLAVMSCCCELDIGCRDCFGCLCSSICCVIESIGYCIYVPVEGCVEMYKNDPPPLCVCAKKICCENEEGSCGFFERLADLCGFIGEKLCKCIYVDEEFEDV